MSLQCESRTSDCALSACPMIVVQVQPGFSARLIEASLRRFGALGEHTQTASAYSHRDAAATIETSGASGTVAGGRGADEMAPELARKPQRIADDARRQRRSYQR